MAYTLFMRYPDFSLGSYDRMMASLELDVNPPGGSILHIAAEGVGGVNVCEVWQTREAAESFVEHRLRDAAKRQGMKEPLSYRIEPLHNLFAADMDMVERIGAVSLPAGRSGQALAS